MAYAVFKYENINIGVEAGVESDIKWLKEFLCPAFSITEGDADVSIQLKVEPELYEAWLSCGPDGCELDAFMLDTEIIAFPVWSVPVNGQVLHDQSHGMFYHIDKEQIVLLCKQYEKNIRTRLMRVVREIAMGMVQSTGARLLHASAFELGGKALIVTGPKEAGKTSVLTYALNNAGASYLANDRLSIRFQGEETRLSGIPTIVSVRSGTFKLFPELHENVVERRYRTHSTLQECREVDAPEVKYHPNGNLGLSPAQWCALFDCPSVNDMPAKAILFPSQTGCSGGLSIRRLETGEAARRLENCMFGHISPDSLSEAFSHIPPGLSKRAPMNDKEFSLRLAGSVNAYECLMGVDAFKDNRGAELLHKTVSTGQAYP